jgi:Tol biopolymer transport system component
MDRVRRVFAVAGIVTVLACTSGGSASTSAPSPTSPPSEAPSLASPTPAVPSPSTSTVVKDDEEWVSFQWVDAEGSDGIFLVRPDGTGLHQIGDMPGSQRHPDWSPDGGRLIFINAPNGGREEFWIVDADGSDATKLATCDLPCNEFNYPDWAEAGGFYYGLDSHATDSTPPTTFEIGHYDFAAGTSTTVLTRTDGKTAEQPRVSPDGKRVAFDRGPIEGETEMAIYVADIKSGEEHRVTDPVSRGAHPDWIGNDQIVFNTYDLGFFQNATEPSNLFVVNVDGTGLRPLTTYGENGIRATQPRITPDGAAIVYTQVNRTTGSRTLAVINTDGSGQRSLTPEPLTGTHPQLRPVP